MATLASIVAGRVREYAAGGKELAAEGNFLGARIGNRVLVDDPDFEGRLFSVAGIRVMAEEAGGRTHRVAEYVLDDADVVAGSAPRLWVCEAGRGGELQAVVLEGRWQGTYAEAKAAGLYHPNYDAARGGWIGPHFETDAEIPALQDPAGLFRDGDVEYRRRFGDARPHDATATDMVDADGDGRLQDAEVAEHRVRYWDYERAGDAGSPLLFAVEDFDGRFAVWLGRELPPEAVHVLKGGR